MNFTIPRHLLNSIVCKSHGLTFGSDEMGSLRCDLGCLLPGSDNIYSYGVDQSADAPKEARVRDLQAGGYLQHAKFPTQIRHLKKFLCGLRSENCCPLALDLGCGPGPATKILIDAGYSVLAVDFSRQSLLLNQARNYPQALMIHADLREIKFRKNVADVLVMADFLQHLGDAQIQRQLLREAFLAMRPNGKFFLSFFNINIWHRLKGDINGSFANGGIPYRRMTALEVQSMLPAGVLVESVRPMNIFHSAFPDKIAGSVPILGRHLARMIVMSGTRHGE